MLPTLTIVTPSFNQASFLDETIRSVVTQRTAIHEYFVVDGGSTDGSVDIIRKYAPSIDWWISEPDKGQSDAIHRGFQRATGDIIAWINSDDVYLPGALQAVRKAFATNPTWDVLTGFLIIIDEQSKIESVCRVPGESLRWARWGVTHVSQPVCFFRRSLYERVGGLDLSLHCVMDTELWCRFFREARAWGFLSQHLAAFRRHGDSKGVSPSWKRRYLGEQRALAERFPTETGTGLRQRAGRWAYRITQLLSADRMRSVVETRRLRGAKLEDVFPAERVSHLERAHVGLC